MYFIFSTKHFTDNVMQSYDTQLLTLYLQTLFTVRMVQNICFIILYRKTIGDTIEWWLIKILVLNQFIGYVVTLLRLEFFFNANASYPFQISNETKYTFSFQYVINLKHCNVHLSSNMHKQKFGRLFVTNLIHNDGYLKN